MHELPVAAVDPEAVADALSAAHGIEVAGMDALDAGVWRVRRRDGPDWVARAFPASRPVDAVRGDAGILAWLAEHDYPAERLAAEDAVSVVDGHPVIVTGFVHPVPREERRDTIKAAGSLRALGGMVARLHALSLAPGAPSRPGGAWHHAAEGAPRAELDAATAWLVEAMATAPAGDREPLAELIAALDDADDGAGLPAGVVHPDPVLANVVAAPGPGMVLVDWAGAGIGPRVWPLAFLLWAEGVKDLRRVDLVAAGYRRVLGSELGPDGALEPEEIERLAGLIPARHLVFTALNVARGRLRPAAAVQSVRTEAARAQRIADRARRVFTARPSAPRDDRN